MPLESKSVDCLVEFVSSNCNEGVDLYIMAKDIRIKYSWLCLEKGITPLGPARLGRIMARLGFPSRMKNGYMVYQCIGWKEDKNHD